ncbi:hypothetical protein [Streptomyces sp. NPDC092952]
MPPRVGSSSTTRFASSAPALEAWRRSATRRPSGYPPVKSP